MSKKLYEEEVKVSKELEVQLKEILSTHVSILNNSILFLKQNKNASFQDVKDFVTNFLNEICPDNYIQGCLYNELYYVYKKFILKASEKAETNYIRNTSVLYLTFSVSGYSNADIVYDHDSTTGGRLRFRGKPGYMQLTRSLPEMDERTSIILNIGHSVKRGSWKVFVFSR